MKISQNETPAGPHQQAKVWQEGASAETAKAAMILVHGRGATAQDILGLSREFWNPDFHFVAPQAAGFAWYPYSFLEPVEKNEPGLSSALQLLHEMLNTLAKSGIPAQKTILLGFSQGACLVTEFAARFPQRFGGIVGLSGGLIGREVRLEDYDGTLEQTPIFLGCSDRDPHIPKTRVNLSEIILKKLDAQVEKRIYPNMAHTINADEIEAVREMMEKVLRV